MELRRQIYFRCRTSIQESLEYKVFQEYYQIGTEDESDEAEAEPKGKGELRSGFTGSHSPFGTIWQIAAATGWSVDYILWGINFPTLQMMLADAPHYKQQSTKTINDGKGKKRSGRKGRDAASFFQSMLKQGSEE